MLKAPVTTLSDESRPKRNLLANALGTAWLASVSLLVVPIYVHYLGVEGYGLVGVFATVQALSLVLDAGLSPTLGRELALIAVDNSGTRSARDLVRTLEVVYWVVAGFLILAALAAGGWVARLWLNVDHLTLLEVERSMVLAGVGLGVNWPAGLYSSGLQGLQRQVLANIVTVAATTFRAVGAIIVLAFVAPTPTAFFAWHVVASSIHTIALAAALWGSLPRSPRARFRVHEIRRVWRFAIGMSGITVVSLLLTQVDKVILTKLLTLQQFGYYTLAGAISTSVVRVAPPFFTTFFPHFSQRVGRGEVDALKRSYHHACQLLTVVMLPSVLVIALFSKEILLLWTGDPLVASRASVLVTLLALGSAMNGLMNMPYALQLAHGWTRFPLMVNSVAVLVLVPASVVASNFWHAEGAASVWIALNLGYVFIATPLMHRRLLIGELGAWYVRDLLLPLVPAVVVVSAARVLVPFDEHSLGSAVKLVAVVSCATGASVVATPSTRVALGILVGHMRHLVRRA